MNIPTLPSIMVAPNGARLTRRDHSRLPVTIEEIIAEAKACHAAGADGLHAHVRDGQGRHVLDAGLYRELIEEMDDACPDMLVQITTEAVGRYTPDQQCAVVRAVRPAAVSIALREMIPDDTGTGNAEIYRECQGDGIAVQHIVYSPEEVSRLAGLVRRGTITEPVQLLFVLGRYTVDQNSRPEMLDPFLEMLGESGLDADWALCAFGVGEFDCLIRGAQCGGKVRVGFENNLLRPDGSPAESNAGQVAAIHREVSAARLACN